MSATTLAEVQSALALALADHQTRCPGQTRHRCHVCRKLESALALLQDGGDW